MGKKIAKERRIYDNYDLDELYPDEMIREYLELDDDEELDDESAWQWRYNESEFDWECAWDELKRFFDGKTVGFFGEVGLWHGVYHAGKIGNFEELFWKAVKDCDYVKIYDENGHLYLTCSHHDGTNHFEIKIVTDDGYDYLDRWEYSGSGDKRTEEEVHNQIFKRYSLLPNFSHKVYGCKVREYEPQSKAGFVNILNNQARSFYS